MADEQVGRVLVTGANGQVGSELTMALRQAHGGAQVIATDIREPLPAIGDSGPFERLNVTDRRAVADAIGRHGVGTVYHLASLLSAASEQRPALAWEVNLSGLMNVLDGAHEAGGVRVFWPSSIAVYGPETPRDRTPQLTVMRPRTVYGITKLTGELLCKYYRDQYGLDVRGVRYPGVISAETLPGGGTTDYAVEMFYAAVLREPYCCFVRADTTLPMVYMPDCVGAALTLMAADGARLRYPASYNLTAMSLSAGQLAEAIRVHEPDFECRFEPDSRQAIADSWPASIDDCAAREDWDWAPRFELAEMTADMLTRLREKHERGEL